jgi:hypothetical protein
MKSQRLEAIVTGIKSSIKEYYKIKEKAKENVKSVLTNSKLLLKFATLSVIESVRPNAKLYNFVIYDISTTNNTITTSYESNSLSLMSGRQQHQQSFNDNHTALVLEEAEKLYNDLTTKLTDKVIAATAASIKASSIPLYHRRIVTIFYKQRIGSCITIRVLSVNVGLPRQVVFNGQIVTTSIFKDPVKGPIMLRKLNLDGDRQADLTVHGELDKAVYSYPAEHYEYYWRKQFPNMDLTWGMFGENFNTEGLMEDDVNVGDQFQIGSAAKLIATQPRMPCYKLGVILDVWM